jgi:hypothetical protein
MGKWLTNQTLASGLDPSLNQRALRERSADETLRKQKDHRFRWSSLFTPHEQTG